MKNFKIIEGVYYNKHGIAESTAYYIQELKPIIPFLGLSKWSYIKEIEGGMGDYYKTPMAFNSMADALNFIDNVLAKNIPREEYKYTEIKTITLP